MKRNYLCAAVLGLIAATGVFAEDAKKAGEALPKCPVMDEPIDFTIRTMTDDGPVYFCCDMCIKKFNENQSRYADKAAKQREMLAKRDRIQVSCPLSGNPIDEKIYVESDGKKVYFCCNGCKGKYAAAPKQYEAKLAGSYTYQTKCPVMGEEIDPTSYQDLPTGQRIYFCCPGCDKKFMKDPAKYAKKLEKQGVNVDVKKLKKAAHDHGHGHDHGAHDGHDHP